MSSVELNVSCFGNEDLESNTVASKIKYPLYFSVLRIFKDDNLHVDSDTCNVRTGGTSVDDVGSLTLCFTFNRVVLRHL